VREDCEIDEADTHGHIAYKPPYCPYCAFVSLSLVLHNICALLRAIRAMISPSGDVASSPISLSSVAFDTTTRSSSLSSQSVDRPSGLPPPSNTKTSSSSVYVALRALSVLHALRRRVKQHLQIKGKTRSKKDTSKFCRDIERQAYEEIDRYLGRKPKSRWSRRSEARPVGVADCGPTRENINQ
jgi:hypothetical protein